MWGFFLKKMLSLPGQDKIAIFDMLGPCQVTQNIREIFIIVTFINLYSIVYNYYRIHVLYNISASILNK